MEKVGEYGVLKVSCQFSTLNTIVRTDTSTQKVKKPKVKIMRNYSIAVTGYVRTSIATLPVQHHQVTAADIILEKTARLIAANRLRRMT